MTIETLEKKLKPLEDPIENALLRWLILHLPPQPVRNRKMHAAYGEAVRILMREKDDLDSSDRAAVTLYLSSIIPFVEAYEKKEYESTEVSPEGMLGFLMEQNRLTQYDLANELGGQPVVSDILNGKRRLTRDHIERLSKRFGVSPATFYGTRPA